jgi:uncharacterized protein YydD (DUF2326 family)
LTHWNKIVFGNVFQKLKELEDEILQLEHQYDTSGQEDSSSLEEAQRKLSQYMEYEEVY